MLEYYQSLANDITPDKVFNITDGNFIINENASFQPLTKLKSPTLELKPKMEFGFNYEEALQNEESFIKNYEYPYYRYFTDDETIRKYMDKLTDYKTTVTDQSVKYPFLKQARWELDFEGAPYTIINYPEEYPDLEVISEYFNQQCRVRCIHHPSKDSHLEYFQSHYKDIIEWLRKEGKPVTPKTMDEAVWKNGPSMCTTFKPKIIKKLIKLFGADRVLDISAGWGDRLIGAIAAGVEEYQGYDPSPCVQKGYKQIVDFFKPKGKFVVDQIPFEEAKPKKGHYDLVMSSPPYFDLEVYVKGEGEKKQSIYGLNERQWYTTKLMEWINVAYDGLRKGGILALNINTVKGQKYLQWLVDDMAKDKRWYRLGTISYAKPDLKAPQPVFIWEKI